MSTDLFRPAAEPHDQSLPPVPATHSDRSFHDDSDTCQRCGRKHRGAVHDCVSEVLL